MKKKNSTPPKRIWKIHVKKKSNYCFSRAVSQNKSVFLPTPFELNFLKVVIPLEISIKWS